jgi:hypothetical protein
MSSFTISSIQTLAPREPQFSLYLNREVLAAKPGGVVCEVEVDGDGIYTVSRLDGEDGWTVDGRFLANGLPVFFNGEGARYCITRQIADEAIVAALNDAAAEVA